MHLSYAFSSYNKCTRKISQLLLLEAVHEYYTYLLVACITHKKHKQYFGRKVTKYYPFLFHSKIDLLIINQFNFMYSPHSLVVLSYLESFRETKLSKIRRTKRDRGSSINLARSWYSSTLLGLPWYIFSSFFFDLLAPL